MRIWATTLFQNNVKMGNTVTHVQQADDWAFLSKWSRPRYVTWHWCRLAAGLFTDRSKVIKHHVASLSSWEECNTHM